jgi:hypothetical protein
MGETGRGAPAFFLRFNLFHFHFHNGAAKAKLDRRACLGFKPGVFGPPILDPPGIAAVLVAALLWDS